MWEVAKELLVILVIPILVWGVSVEVRTAVAAEKYVQVSLELNKMDAIGSEVRQNALKLARLEGKVDTANARLDEIRRLLKAPSSP